MDKRQLAKMIDHTILGANITSEEVKEKCAEVRKYGFASLCTEPYFVPLVSKELEGTSGKVCTVIGFPFGNTTTIAKVEEAKKALQDGADELDMVMNISVFKDGQLDYVKEDIRAVVEIKNTINREALIKVIIETCYLSEEEIRTACKIAQEAGTDFVKTSTGFGIGGAKVEDVKIMRETVGPELGVKASGGIRSYHDALKMIEAGATRIGTSSGVKIIEEAK